MPLSAQLFPLIIDGLYLHSFCLWDYRNPQSFPNPPTGDGEITLSLGGLKVIICGGIWGVEALWFGSYAATRVVMWACEERLNWWLIAPLCSLNGWCVIERGHLKEGEQDKHQTLLPRPHNASPFISFYRLPIYVRMHKTFVFTLWGFSLDHFDCCKFIKKKSTGFSAL